jgi:hypothetical protein
MGKLHPMARATALFAIFVACGAAILATASPAMAGKACWKQVVDDWSQDGNIDGRYSARCIDEALAKVPEDIRAYSDFEEQAKSARLLASRTPQIVGGDDDDDTGGSGTGSGSGDGNQPVEEREPDTGPRNETPVQSVLGTSGNNADSIPVPLLVLLGLAAALITAGGVGFGARKLRAHRASD